MILYAIIMLLTAAVFAVMAVLIYRGKTELIHDYHQSKVKDKAAYGKAFGKAMGVIAAAMAISGVISLFGESFIWPALAVLTVGLVAGFVWIYCVQKKFNGGVF